MDRKKEVHSESHGAEKNDQAGSHDPVDMVKANPLRVLRLFPKRIDNRLELAHRGAGKQPSVHVSVPRFGYNVGPVTRSDTHLKSPNVGCY
jgi:hypothetical protein